MTPVAQPEPVHLVDGTYVPESAMYVVTVSRATATVWSWWTANPQGGGGGSTAKTKTQAIACGMANVPSGATYRVVTRKWDDTLVLTRGPAVKP